VNRQSGGRESLLLSPPDRPRLLLRASMARLRPLRGP